MRNPNARIPDLSRIFSPAGSCIHVTHEARFNGRTLILVETGTINIQDSIEAYAPYTDLNYMLSRLKVGDTSVLASRSPMYGDFFGLPNNPIDAINLVNSAEAQFLQMDSSERQTFNNDYRVWLAHVLSGGANSNAGKAPVSSGPVSFDPKSEPVKE